MQTVISDMNAEYQAKINETKGTVAYDVLEMSGTRAEQSARGRVYRREQTANIK